MPNTTKQDIISEVASQNGMTQVDTKAVFEEFLSLVGEHLQAGRTIEIRGFGTFYSKRRRPRPARNPRTGEIVPLGDRVVPLFKFSSDIRQVLDGKIRREPGEVQEISIAQGLVLQEA